MLINKRGSPNREPTAKLREGITVITGLSSIGQHKSHFVPERGQLADTSKATLSDVADQVALVLVARRDSGKT